MEQFVNENINTARELMMKYMYMVIKVIEYNSVDFLKFLIDKNVFQMGIAVLISSQLTILTNALTDVVISPITSAISNDKAKSVSEWTVSVLGIKFKIGLLIQTIVNFILILVVIFYMWKLIDLKNYNFVNDMIAKSTRPN